MCKLGINNNVAICSVYAIKNISKQYIDGIDIDNGNIKMIERNH